MRGDCKHIPYNDALMERLYTVWERRHRRDSNEPNGFLVHHLSHSVTVSLQRCASKPECIIIPQNTVSDNYCNIAILDYHHHHHQLQPDRPHPYGQSLY